MDSTKPQLGNAMTTMTSLTRYPAKPHPQGGQHRSPAGVTTLDSLSISEWAAGLKARIDDIVAEAEQQQFGRQAGREW
jgi:hypothetical protein